jgi:hypothetical protein
MKEVTEKRRTKVIHNACSLLDNTFIKQWRTEPSG